MKYVYVVQEFIDNGLPWEDHYVTNGFTEVFSNLKSAQEFVLSKKRPSCEPFGLLISEEEYNKTQFHKCTFEGKFQNADIWAYNICEEGHVGYGRAIEVNIYIRKHLLR